ncbi:MAG: ABC transporter ATP-binding protein/permease [Peptococcaceae bacterium]|jgi:ATP-binding cassette subfamily B protein|nr:ABC transporter ATP-binding protein/permease [Peptococcaceae bacterium]
MVYAILGVIMGMVKKFIAYYRPHMKLFLADMFCALLVAVCGVLYPVVTRRIINQYVPDHDARMILLSGAVLLGIYFLKAGLNYFIQYYGHAMGVRITIDMRAAAFNHLQRLPFSYFDQTKSGTIMSRIINDTFEIAELSHHGPEDLFISIVTMAASFWILSMTSLPLTLIIFAFLPFLLWFTLAKRIRLSQTAMKTRVEIGEVNAELENSIAGVRVSKAYESSKHEIKKFQSGIKLYAAAREEQYRAMAEFFSGTGLIMDLLVLVTLISGGLFAYYEKINIGDFTAYLLFVGLFTEPIKKLINFVEQLQLGMSGFVRIQELMDIPPEEDEPGAAELEKVRGDILFDRVTFRYEAHDNGTHGGGTPSGGESHAKQPSGADGGVRDGDSVRDDSDARGGGSHNGGARDNGAHGGETPSGGTRDGVSREKTHHVLEDLVLEIKAGQTVALVGPSGAGKSTLCHLLPRFYDLDSGRILLDGVDIRSYTRLSLRRKIGMVQQDTFLFAGSVRDNIAYGNFGATDQAIIAAAKSANIHEFIESLPEGYDTYVGERGVMLSGGQKQRVSIARVFLKDPPILILDEATSSLDNTTELAIQHELDRLSVGRTTLVVAHRLSTIRSADKIVFVADSGILEEGTHDELMARGGAYAQLSLSKNTKP